MQSEIGTCAILNVGTGDTKISFDKKNPADVIRARRIITDMLRRGFALIIELPDKTHQRVLEFNEATDEYIIADFDPVQAEAADKTEESHEQEGGPTQGAAEEEATIGAAPPEQKGKRGRPRKAVHASGVRAVAVARSAGG